MAENVIYCKRVSEFIDRMGLEGWSESLAFELKPFGINVKTVPPREIVTDFAGDHWDIKRYL